MIYKVLIFFIFFNLTSTFDAICLKKNNSSCDNIKKYSDYFTQLNSFEADFNQYVNGEWDSMGRFFLLRPNRIMADYQSGAVKAKISVIDNNVTFWDKDLDQYSHLSASQFPLQYILSSKIALEKDVILNSCVEKDSYYLVNFSLKEKETADMIFSIKFDKNSSKITAIGSEIDGNKVLIQFDSVKENIAIDNKVFIIKDTRL